MMRGLRLSLSLCLLFLVGMTTAHLAADSCRIEDDDELHQLCPQLALERDLAIVSWINGCLCERFPVTYNHYLGTGYLNMPGARMQQRGVMSGGYSSVPPYDVINLAFQPFSHLECSLNYRIYNDFPDPILGSFGFGDLSDRGISAKLAVIRGEDYGYTLPSIAIGADDFLGTKGFKSQYIVATQVWPEYHVEASLGYGLERIHGVFGGVTWMPWRHSCNRYLEGISLVTEYDAIDYKNPERERHPNGSNLSHRFNYGVKWRLWDVLDLSLSRVRGEETAFSLSYYFDIGCEANLLPYLDDTPLYCAPIVTEPLGCLRTKEVLAQDLFYSLSEHGFTLFEAGIHHYTSGYRELRLVVFNEKWLYEDEVRERLTELLLALTPDNIDRVVVVCEAEGFPVQEYQFCTAYMQWVRSERMCRYELEVLSPASEVSTPICTHYTPIYSQNRPCHCWELLPKTNFLFGSSQGKFKYALGVKLCNTGFLFNDYWYRLTLGYIAASSIPHSTHDILNPSQLPNVHTDVLMYYRKREITIDAAYLQRHWNMGCGLYTRLVGGYLSQFYAGYGAEVLYYPVKSHWAAGIDVAKVYKRETSGLGLKKTVRQMKGSSVKEVTFDLWQAFADVYYAPTGLDVDFKLSVGRFLAGDLGARFEVGQTFSSGLRVSAWYTHTNGRDRINGKTYHDRGISFSMPLDIFLTYACTDTWGHSVSAWLRDVGYRTSSGDSLYPVIRRCRRHSNPCCRDRCPYAQY